MAEPLQLNIEQFDYTVNLLQAVLWQYDEATNLLGLVNQKQEWYDEYQTAFWANWYEYVFYLANPDLTTNSETQDLALFGLAVWSIILNVPLYVPLMPESDTKPIFGFNAYAPSFPTLENTYLNFFGSTSTWSGANFSTAGQVIELSLAEQQFLLMLKYFQLITRDNMMSLRTYGVDPTTQQIIDLPFYACSVNSFLDWLCSTFGENIGYTGTIYALDNLDMSITYVFTEDNFPVDLFEAIVDLDLLPRPAAVEIKFFTEVGEVWGLGVFNQNFNNGNFIPEDFES